MPSLAGQIAVHTERRTQFREVTIEVQKLVTRLLGEAGPQSAVCHVYVSHTTAGVTINENADPDVAADMEATFDRLVPRDPRYRHAEGNSDSHVKASLVGSSATVFISGGKLELGRWQGIYLCEFDGPRRRELRVRVVLDPA